MQRLRIPSAISAVNTCKVELELLYEPDNAIGMATVNVETPDVVSRRVLVLSGGAVLALLLATAAFFALRGRTAPLWLTRHSSDRPTTP
jgi:hypothetical protein